MVAVFPEGFEEREEGGRLELAAYTERPDAVAALEQLGPVRELAVVVGWENAWRRFHRPVRIGPLWIGPSWETPEADATPVVIDPGRAFGTGAHATTRLCLELLLGLGLDARDLLHRERNRPRRRLGGPARRRVDLYLGETGGRGDGW